jgi:hypothetical protein
MKDFLILILLIIFSSSSYSQGKLKCSEDSVSKYISYKVDSTVWKFITIKEYEDQNPGALDFLNNDEFIFYAGYIPKDSSNILLPPALMILGMKAPGNISEEMFKDQAKQIFSEESILSKRINEYENEFGEVPLMLKAMLESDNYYDESLQALISQVKLPGKTGEENIMLMAMFYNPEVIVSFKIIYLEESQVEFLKYFAEIIENVEFEK